MTTRPQLPLFPFASTLVLALATTTACGKDQRPLPEAEPAQEQSGDGDGDDAQEEYMGSAVVIPATIEAEAFVAANELDRSWDEQDETCTNPASPGTDILEAEDGGCVIGYTQQGEYLEYDIYVPQTGSYDLSLLVGTGMSATLDVSVDEELRGSVVVPLTSWTEYVEVPLAGINLTQGEHRLRITIASGAANFDRFTILDAGDCISSCSEQECGMDQCGNSCGSCAGDETCTEDFQCLDPGECLATCGEKLCGQNACGTSCGTCEGQLVCTPTGACWDGSVTPIARHGQLSVSGNKIVDENGEVTQLKGVSTQWLNWEQAYSTSKSAMLWMRDNWALSLFRLANGVENNGGYLEVPAERLEMVEQIIENAIENEVYVIVDWHTHEPEHVDEAKAFFAHIASTYGDEPNIIYEIFNEPLQLDWSTELKPYHEEVIAEIRAHDPDNLIVAGTPQWDQRPDAAIGDPLDDPNVVYTLHFYACTHTDGIRANGTAALEAGLPLMVTEWGATHADGGTPNNPGVCESSAREWHDWMEENDISWAAWKMTSDVDASAFLVPSASLDGGWGADDLKGHGYLIHEFMMDER